MGESHLLLGPHGEGGIGAVGARPHAPYGSDAFPPLRNDEIASPNPIHGRSRGLVLTREKAAGKWGATTYAHYHGPAVSTLTRRGCGNAAPRSNALLRT
jgi:hypothetical protein